ncbi:MAG: hypothetical protein ACLFSY_02245 [Desulfonatronovibrionaceae bacterium]
MGCREGQTQKGCKISWPDGFLYRGQYFWAVGVIGSMSFVQDAFCRFKHLFTSGMNGNLQTFMGVDRFYPMKRLGAEGKSQGEGS